MRTRAAATTVVDAVIPGTSVWREIALIFSASLLTALCAQIVVPFFPVPVTGQTFAVLVTGALLGSRRGALGQLAYLAQGMAGLPVFYGGHSGLAHALGPTGGYLVGFVAAAFVVGWLAERGWDRRVWSTAAAMFLGNATIYLFGLAWLAYIYQFGVWWPLQSPLGPLDLILSDGLLKFIPGDLVKLGLGAVTLPSAWKLVQRYRY